MTPGSTAHWRALIAVFENAEGGRGRGVAVGSRQQRAQPTRSRPVVRPVVTYHRCGGMAVRCWIHHSAAPQAVPAAALRHRGGSGSLPLKCGACPSSSCSCSSWLAGALPLWMKVSFVHLDVGYNALFSAAL